MIVNEICLVNNGSTSHEGVYKVVLLELFNYFEIRAQFKSVLVGVQYCSVLVQPRSSWDIVHDTTRSSRKGKFGPLIHDTQFNTRIEETIYITVFNILTNLYDKYSDSLIDHMLKLASVKPYIYQKKIDPLLFRTCITEKHWKACLCPNWKKIFIELCSH